MPVITPDASLDPIEQLIQDAFATSPYLSKEIYGPYFTYTKETRGLPYMLIKPAGGGKNIFCMPQSQPDRPLIEQPDFDIQFWGTDKEIVRKATAAFDKLFQAKTGSDLPPMKEGHVCISVMPILAPWFFIYGNKDPLMLNVDIYSARRWFRFVVESRA